MGRNPKEYEVISTFKIPDGSTPSWSRPVIAGGHLYLRDKDRLLCYDLRQPEPIQLPDPHSSDIQ